MSNRPGLALSSTALALLAGASTSCDGAATRTKPPVISQLAVTANPYNALSRVVSFNAADADSARVVYWSSGHEPARSTPFERILNGGGQIAVLGLAANTPYTVAVEASGAATARSQSLDVAPGTLPAALQGVHLVMSGASSAGYTLIAPEYFGAASAGYLLIFDDTGALRWYREFDGDGFAVEAKQQVNGDFTVYLGHSFGWQPTAGHFVQVKPTGEIVRTFAVSAPYFTDPHEMLLTFGDSTIEAVHLLGYAIKSFDLGMWNGPPDAPLAVHVIERQNALGAREFLWDSGDHFTPADWPALNPQEPDLDHPSSLDLDADGNYVVSFQALDEIDKIDARSGGTIWRFGGRHGQFAIQGDPRGGFRGQHSVRVLPNGNLLFLDNHTRELPLAARAVEYSLDTIAMTARLVWQYEPVPPVANPVMGSVQRLASGNTLVGFADVGRIVEVDPAGRVVCDATLVDGSGAPIQFYRALRIASLYRYERP